MGLPRERCFVFVAEGDTLDGIVGEWGSGKTMLSLALMGLEPPGARVAAARLGLRRATANA